MYSLQASSGERLRFQRNVYRALAVVAASLAILASGCGGSSSPTPLNNTLSAAQAQAISGQVVQALTTALGNSFGGITPPAKGVRPSLSKVFVEARPDTSSGCTSTPTGESCNLPLSFTGPCTGGGTISVSGDIDGTLDNSGDGSFATQITVTPTSCSVAGTTFNGDPNIMIDGQIGFVSNNFVYPVTFMETGGISFGPNPSGTCQVNVTYTFNSSSCTVTGTVCGKSVNGSC
jgi:hypothetical protein